MVSEKTLELINVAIDEMATPSERAALAEILGSSDTALHEFEALSLVNSHLREAAAIETPSVHDGVMEEIRRRTAQPKSTVIAASGRFNRRRIVFAGWAIAAAVGVVVLLTPFVGNHAGLPSFSGAGVSGAMAPIDLRAWPEIATARSSSGLVAAVRGQNEQLAVTVSVPEPADVTVAWPAGTLTAIQPASPDDRGAAADRTIHCATGDCPVVLLQNTSGRPVEITVSARHQGEPLYLRVGRP